MGRRKGRSQQTFDRKIERTFFRLIPELPRMFRKLTVELENFDGSQPKTFLASLENDCNRVGKKLKTKEPRLRGFFFVLLKRFTGKLLARTIASNLIRIAKASAASDTRYSLLLRLFHEVDQRVPFGSLLVAYHYADGRAFCYYTDAKAFFVAQSTALNFYRRAEDTVGEERALFALEAFSKTVELVYKPYLTMLWFLSYVKVGKRLPTHVPALGSVFRVVVDRLSDYKGIFEPDVVWMRNSAVHNQPDYVLGEDCLLLVDQNRCQRKIAVSDLMALTRRIYVISTQTIQWVSLLYLVREVLLRSGLLDVLADCMTYELMGAENELNQADLRLKTHAEALFEPLQRFLEKSKPSQSA